MSHRDRTRRQQIVREAEGYLELATLFADRWPLSPAVRDAVASRSLSVLERLGVGARQSGVISYLRGLALRTMERYAEAIEPLRTATEEEPENLGAWLALAWCHKRTGRIDLAIDALEDALAVDPTQAIVYYNLACYWSLAKNVQLAVEHLSRAFEIDPAFRDLVDEEADFDSIRNRPEFQSLTSAIV